MTGFIEFLGLVSPLPFRVMRNEPFLQAATPTARPGMADGLGSSSQLVVVSWQSWQQKAQKHKTPNRASSFFWAEQLQLPPSRHLRMEEQCRCQYTPAGVGKEKSHCQVPIQPLGTLSPRFQWAQDLGMVLAILIENLSRGSTCPELATAGLAPLTLKDVHSALGFAEGLLPRP